MLCIRFLHFFNCFLHFSIEIFPSFFLLIHVHRFSIGFCSNSLVLFTGEVCGMIKHTNTHDRKNCKTNNRNVVFMNDKKKRRIFWNYVDILLTCCELDCLPEGIVCAALPQTEHVHYQHHCAMSAARQFLPLLARTGIAEWRGLCVVCYLRHALNYGCGVSSRMC